MDYVQIDGKIYSRHEFAEHYGLNYYQVLKLYNKGLRGKELLEAVQKEDQQRSITIAGRTFSSKRAAAQYYHLSPSTFYRRYKNGTLTLDDFTTRKS
ncbi:hypothetical protein [Limosilactobacillus oris]|uniref:hypothetical protein n=1 Tax=Limosilactobacillus oris TaxID=1632 RepID=UPI0038906E98